MLPSFTKNVFQLFTWLRTSLKRDGVSFHLRYQSYCYYAFLMFTLFGASKRQAHRLLKLLFLDLFPQIRQSYQPQKAYETVIELCSLLFLAGLGQDKCSLYGLSRDNIINRFGEYSESSVSFIYHPKQPEMYDRSIS